MKKKEGLVLDKGDCAIIIRADGSEELVLPDRPEGEEIGEAEWKCLVLAVALSSQDIFDELSEHLSAEMDEEETPGNKGSLN